MSHLNHFIAWAAERMAGLTYVGPDPHHGLGLESIVEGYGACGSRSPILAAIAERGAAVLDLDLPDVQDAAAMLRRPEVTEFLRRGGKDAPCFVFKSSDAVEGLAREAGLNLIVSRAAQARRWENKLEFAERAKSLDLRVPAWEVATTPAELEEARRRLGGDVVIQAPHGYAGARTLRAQHPNDAERIARQLRAPRLRVGPTIAGASWTLNACVTWRGVAVSAPTLQLTGVPSLTLRALGACGNDGTRTTPAAAQMQAQARELGQALAQDGVAGLFGVDFIVDAQGAAWLLEVNPRLVSSVSLATQLEVDAGRLPMLARHFVALIEPQADAAPLDLAATIPLGGSQIVLHNLARVPLTVTGKVASGAWRPGRAPGIVARPAVRSPQVGNSVPHSLLGGLGEGEWLLIASGRGRVRAPGAEVARLQRAGAVTDQAGNVLDEVVAAADEVYAALALAPGG